VKVAGRVAAAVICSEKLAVHSASSVAEVLSSDGLFDAVE